MSLSEVPNIEPGPTPPHQIRRPSGPPDPVMVEIDMLRLVDELEDATIEYHDICREAALAEVSYKHAYHSAMVQQMFVKTTEKMKVSQAEVEASGAARGAALARELQRSKFAYIQGLHERIGALRTLSANYRRQG